MSVTIIIDSASDLLRQEAVDNQLIFLPLRTRIDETEYLDGVTITHEEFYEKLAHCTQLPSTSQLTPYAFSQPCQEAVDRGDEVVIITLSGKLSGTAQSAKMAAEPFGGKVRVLDSENVSIGERILIEYALRLRQQGLGADAMVQVLEQAKKRICVVALVDTLEYLVKGGRLSKTAAVAGTMLQIKPVLSVEDGALTVLGKARGARQSNNFLNQIIHKRGIDFSMPYALAYSGTDDTLLRNYIDSSRGIWEAHTDALPIRTIGSTIGTHVGPGVIATAFFAAGTEGGAK